MPIVEDPSPDGVRASDPGFQLAVDERLTQMSHRLFSVGPVKLKMLGELQYIFTALIEIHFSMDYKASLFRFPNSASKELVGFVAILENRLE